MSAHPILEKYSKDLLVDGELPSTETCMKAWQNPKGADPRVIKNLEFHPEMTQCFERIRQTQEELQKKLEGMTEEQRQQFMAKIEKMAAEADKTEK